jgi:hypothetical protein
LLFHMEIILLKILFYYFRGLLKIVCFEIFWLGWQFGHKNPGHLRCMYKTGCLNTNFFYEVGSSAPHSTPYQEDQNLISGFTPPGGLASLCLKSPPCPIVVGHTSSGNSLLVLLGYINHHICFDFVAQMKAPSGSYELNKIRFHAFTDHSR